MKRGGFPVEWKAAPSAWAPCFEDQVAGLSFFLRRPSTAAAAAPNRIIIGGAGTGVPLLEPCHPLEVDELPLVDDDVELLVDEDVELLLEVEDELDVLLVMLPELDVLVDTSPELDEVVVLEIMPLEVEVEPPI
jgi:hypothetical protein